MKRNLVFVFQFAKDYASICEYIDSQFFIRTGKHGIWEVKKETFRDSPLAVRSGKAP